MRNEFDRLRRQAEINRQRYPAGTRIQLNHMNDPWSPVPGGTRGTVACVDDIGQLHMRWDNGRSLPLNTDEDSFRRLTEQEIAEENGQAMNADANAPDPEMGMKMGGM